MKKQVTLRPLLYNAIQTPDGTIIVSRHVHDFICYLDKNGKRYCVDGGLSYAKRSCEDKDYKELSIYDDGKHKTRRSSLYWGTSFDENLKPLKETVWNPIKDLSTQHIENILKNVLDINPLYKKTFRRELLYRENKTI